MKTAKCITDNIIIQSGRPFKIWGSDAEGLVYIELKSINNIISVNANAKNGYFCAEFPAMPAGFDKFTLTVKNKGEFKNFNNVRFGEVFLFAGQSNMSYPASAMENYGEIIADTNNSDNISILSIKDAFIQENGEIFRPDKPQDDLCGEYLWQDLSEGVIKTSSAFAVMTGIILRKRLNAPVGLIDTSLGGVSIDTYLSRQMADGSRKVKDFLISAGKYIAEGGKYNIYGITNYTQMCGIYNEKICPILNFNIKAIIWYQGENSAAAFKHSEYYYYALKSLIKGYREIFRDSRLPVVSINIASTYYPYGEYGYNYINEAINNACKLPFCYAVPQYDVMPKWLIANGDKYFHPIHPVNKKTISIRTADIISANLYEGKKLKFPSVKSVKYYEAYALAEIGDLSMPLKKQETIYGFTVANENKIYYKAKAEIVSENKVKVYNADVKNPKYITYAFFQYNHICNLMSKDNMPVLQYRTLAEECQGKKYYFTELTESCDFKKVREDNFGYECGGGYFADAWNAGMITARGNAAIKFNKKEKLSGKTCLEIIHKKSPDDYGYFGISPDVNVCGQQNNFKNFNAIACNIKAENNVEFHGVLAKINGGKIIKFRVLKDGLPQVCVNLCKEYCLYEIDLKSYQTGEESAHITTDEILRQINTLEFYFRSEGDSTVFFNNYELK